MNSGKEPHEEIFTQNQVITGKKNEDTLNTYIEIGKKGQYSSCRKVLNMKTDILLPLYHIYVFYSSK